MATSIAEGLKVSGLPEISAALSEIGGRVATNLARRGVYAGGVVLRDEARRLVLVRTGALKKATVVKRGDPLKGVQSISYGIAKVRFVMRGRVTKSGRISRRLRRVTGKGGKGFIVPRLYAHLVELGTKRTRKHSFILRAAETKAQAALNAMVSKMKGDLDAEIAKLRHR